jgi:hypothetical protein
MHHRTVAAQAIVLQDRPVMGSDLDGFREVLQRKGDGMPIAVGRFRNPFGNEGVREMAFDAGCLCPMAASLPGIVLGAHDMAVDAGIRIRTEIGSPFGIDKGESTQAQQNASQYGNQQNPSSWRAHWQRPRKPCTVRAVVRGDRLSVRALRDRRIEIDLAKSLSI